MSAPQKATTPPSKSWHNFRSFKRDFELHVSKHATLSRPHGPAHSDSWTFVYGRKMTTVIAPYLYTEAPLSIEPTHPNSTLHISTESAGLFSGRKRGRIEDSDAAQDEDSYAKRHLASEGSIFFRRKSRTPRSFVWRILQDRKVLELQCVDLVQAKTNTQESVLTYVLSFANPIRPNGIAFADPELHDALEIFALTTGNELFTFSLSKGILLKNAVPSSEDFDASSCYKCYKPTSFSFKHPYKLVATSSLELFISLHDGGLLRLDRAAADNGTDK